MKEAAHIERLIITSISMPMLGTTKDRGHRDRDRIDTRQEHECRYWSDKLGVRADKIREAVKAVGPIAKDVERYLRDEAEVARSA